jgi:hypothetical protein
MLADREPAVFVSETAPVVADELLRGDPERALADLIRAELLRPAPPAVESLIAAIRARHGDGVASILLYGSCLRSGRYDQGVIDLYALVDGYRAVYSSSLAALANVVLPPTVYYLETPGAVTVRSKYAVLSHAQYLSGASLDCFQSVIWARFSQPAVLVYARDAAAIETAVRGATESTLTLMLLATALSASDGTITRVCPGDLWRRGLAATYGAELRVEQPETVAGLYTAAPERYDLAARLALRVLAERGMLALVDDRGDTLDIAMDAAVRRTVQGKWVWRRRAGKPLAGARLLKALVTFGSDSWVPYGLWKLERHTGIRVTLSERQRRWVWITAWPVIFRLLFRRVLR